MSFLDIFSSKTVDKSVDALIDSGDALFFTDEEKSKASFEILKAKIEMIKSNGNFQVAQRYLATMFGLNFILAFWIGVYLSILGDKPDYEAFIGVITAFSIGWIMVAIITFYFGGGFLNSFKGIKAKS